MRASHANLLNLNSNKTRMLDNAYHACYTYST